MDIIDSLKFITGALFNLDICSIAVNICTEKHYKWSYELPSNHETFV